MIKIDKSVIEKYITKKYKHSSYDITVDISDHLRFHFDGYTFRDVVKFKKRENPYFFELIDTRRPSESEHIKEYRRKIYLPKTKQPCFKILNCLKKIVKSPDWSIDYSKSDKPSKIREGEHLEDYCEKNLPFFGSVENWSYSYAIKEMLVDPNGLIAVLPISYEVDPTEFRKPFPYIIPSENVYEFNEGQLAVFKTSKTYEYLSDDGTYRKECIIAFVTKTEVWEAQKINSKGDYSLELKMNLPFNKMPVFRMGSVFKDVIDNSSIYESFVSACLPGLDSAAREISDLDAEVVQHIFTTMWYIAPQNCRECNGTGSILKQGKQIVCSTCNGDGAIAKSPYKDLKIKPPSIDEQANKPPYAGYIEKNIDIVKIQDERIAAHIREALGAVNMEFLSDVPLNESGKSKEVDRDDLNSFVYGVAYHLVINIIDNVYYFINEIRVMDMGFSEEQNKSMLPKVIVPERFEILSESYLQQQVATAKTANLDPLITGILEIDFVNKKYENYPEVRETIKTIKQLDPLPSMTPEQKDASVLSGTILKEDAIVSNYITQFVERAKNEHDDFLKMDYEKKQEIIIGYAKEKLDAAKKIQEEKMKAAKKSLTDEINGGTRKAA